jgi:hypothetical protein
MLAKYREIEERNKELESEIIVLTAERDAARKLAEEISHLLTYASEQGNRKGLVCLK